MEHKGADASVEQSAGESRLGEAWNVHQVAAVDDDDEDDEGPDGIQAVTGDRGAGVLGMIKQIKAQTERRGTAGINI